MELRACGHNFSWWLWKLKFSKFWGADVWFAVWLSNIFRPLVFSLLGSCHCLACRISPLNLQSCDVIWQWALKMLIACCLCDLFLGRAILTMKVAVIQGIIVPTYSACHVFLKFKSLVTSCSTCQETRDVHFWHDNPSTINHTLDKSILSIDSGQVVCKTWQLIESYVMQELSL